MYILFHNASLVAGISSPNPLPWSLKCLSDYDEEYQLCWETATKHLFNETASEPYNLCLRSGLSVCLNAF